MREDVNIILNEHEPRKAAAAEELAAKLSSRGITASRISVEKHLSDIVLERLPHVVVTDYLLEDFGTGIDLLNALRQAPDKPVEVIFFTDEPSLGAAVEAMRCGARDYIEIDLPDGLERVVKQVEAVVVSRSLETRPPSPLKFPALTDLVFSSSSGTALRNAAELVTEKRASRVLIFGREGSGKQTMARAIAHELGCGAPVKEWDLRLTDRPIEEIAERLGSSGMDEIPLRILRHAEEDAAAILRALSHRRHARAHESGPAFCTIVCTHEQDALRILKNMPGIEVVRIPPLAERKEDIPILAQRALHQASKLLAKRAINLDEESLAWLLAKDFPGEIRELEAVALNGALRAGMSGTPLLACMQESASLWEQEWREDAEAPPVSALTAAKVFHHCNHDLRIAALRLGVSSFRLREILGERV